MRRFIRELKTLGNSLRGVEVGVERGDNAEDILRCSSTEHLSLVDIWKPFIQDGEVVWDHDICERNYQHVLTRFADVMGVKAEVLRMPSVDASKRFKQAELDFVYIDACHQYESVAEDIRVWLPKLRKGGLLAGHDYHPKWPGTIRAAEEAAAERNVVLLHGFGPRESVEDWWFYA